MQTPLMGKTLKLNLRQSSNVEQTLDSPDVLDKTFEVKGGLLGIEETFQNASNESI